MYIVNRKGLIFLCKKHNGDVFHYFSVQGKYNNKNGT